MYNPTYCFEDVLKIFGTWKKLLYDFTWPQPTILHQRAYDTLPYKLVSLVTGHGPQFHPRTDFKVRNNELG